MKFGKQNYRLNISCPRKHVYRCNFFKLISKLQKKLYISCQCSRIARYVDNPLYACLSYRLEQLRLASRPRRVKNCDISFPYGFCYFRIICSFFFFSNNT